MRLCVPSLLSCSLLALLFFLQAFSSVSSETAVEHACKWGLYLNYDFCVTSLQADPRSQSADTEGLVLIALDLSIANATSTKSKFEGLLKSNSSDPFYKSWYTSCIDKYNDDVPVLRQAAEEVKSKKYYHAFGIIDSVVYYPLNCEALYTERNRVNSPLFKENNDLFWLQNTAQGIVAILTGRGQ